MTYNQCVYRISLIPMILNTHAPKQRRHFGWDMELFPFRGRTTVTVGTQFLQNLGKLLFINITQTPRDCATLSLSLGEPVAHHSFVLNFIVSIYCKKQSCLRSDIGCATALPENVVQPRTSQSCAVPNCPSRDNTNPNRRAES